MCEKCRELEAQSKGQGRAHLTLEEANEIQHKMVNDHTLGPFGARYQPLDRDAPMNADQRLRYTKQAMDALFNGTFDVTMMAKENMANDGLTLYMGLAGPNLPKGANKFSCQWRAGWMLFFICFWRFRFCITNLDLTRVLECYGVVQHQLARILAPAAMDAAYLMSSEARDKAERSDLEAFVENTLNTLRQPPQPNPFQRPPKDKPPLS